MNKKKAEMLFLILKCSEATQLSDLWALSAYESSLRTIRSDINHINDFLREHDLPTLAVHRDGLVEFTGDANQRNRALHVLLNQMDYYRYRLDSQERARVLICHLIQAGEYVNHKELCSVVYVSRGTLYTDMQQCARIAEEYGLTLSSGPSKGYIVEGTEWDKRRALNKMQRRWSEKGENAYSDYKSILNLLEEQHDFVFTDRGYLETLRYIEISLSRIRQGHVLHEIPNSGKRKTITLEESSGAAFVWQHLVEKFQVTPSAEEIIALELQLRTCGRVAARKQTTPEGLSAAVEAFFQDLSRTLGLPACCTADTQTEMRMFMSSMRFGCNEEYEKNQLVHRSLEAEFPGLFDAVAQAAPELERWLGRNLIPQELYQLTLFAASALEGARTVNNFHRLLLVCDGGPGEADYLRVQLLRLFPVTIVAVTADHAAYRYVPEERIELVVSTVPLNIPDKPVIQVSPVLTRQDVEKIQRGLLEIGLGSRYASN